MGKNCQNAYTYVSCVNLYTKYYGFFLIGSIAHLPQFLYTNFFVHYVQILFAEQIAKSNVYWRFPFRQQRSRQEAFEGAASEVCLP